MSVREEQRSAAAEPSGPAPSAAPTPARSSSMEAEAEAEATAEAVPRLRRLSLPGDFSGAVRHYHMHEHHYHVYEERQCCCSRGSGGWGSAPWQLWQPRHMRHGGRHAKQPPCCSGAWAPPWVFGVFPFGKKAGKFSMAGGLLFLVAMALCRGVVWLVRVHRPQPPALE